MRLRYLFYLAIVIVLTHAAHADGAFFKRGATELPPPIPRQQALISFRDGIETLLVESAVENDGSDLAWIIPVPAKPTRYEAVEPGLLETLRVYTQTPVEDSWDSHKVFLYVAMLAIAILVSFVIIPRGYFGYRRPWIVLLLIPFIYFFALTHGFDHSKSELAAMAGTTVHGVTLLEGRQIGDYDASLLNVTDVTGLQDWLVSEGFGNLPDNAAAIIKQYIAEKWLFIAARLRPQADGTLRPHPIAISFATNEAVYPMRLTSVSGAPTYVELYVVSDRQARPWKRVLELHRSTGVARPNIATTDSCTSALSDREGSDFYIGGLISHPKASLFFWDGAVVTKLAGTFKPSAMKNDVRLDFGPYERFTRRAITKDVAVATTTVVGFMAFLTLAFLGDCIFWTLKTRRFRRYVFLVAVPTVLGTLAALVVVALRLPPIAVASKPEHDASDRWYALVWSEFARNLDESHPEAWTDPALLRQFAEEYIAKLGVTNPYQGGPVHEERSPGNYVVLQNECGTYIQSFAGDTIAEVTPRHEDLTQWREDRKAELEQAYMETALAYMLPPAIAEQYGDSGPTYISNLRFAENLTETGKEIYSRFQISTSGLAFLVGEWQKAGVLQQIPPDRQPPEFGADATAVDIQTGATLLLPWWNDRPKNCTYEIDVDGRVTTVEEKDLAPVDSAFYRWPVTQNHGANAEVTILVCPGEFEIATVFAHVKVRNS